MNTSMPMGEKPRTIRKGAARRDAACFQTVAEIRIPEGTVLRSVGDDKFVAQVGPSCEFSIIVKPGGIVPAEFKKVIVA